MDPRQERIQRINSQLDEITENLKNFESIITRMGERVANFPSLPDDGVIKTDIKNSARLYNKIKTDIQNIGQNLDTVNQATLRSLKNDYEELKALKKRLDEYDVDLLPESELRPQIRHPLPGRVNYAKDDLTNLKTLLEEAPDSLSKANALTQMEEFIYEYDGFNGASLDWPDDGDPENEKKAKKEREKYQKRYQLLCETVPLALSRAGLLDEEARVTIRDGLGAIHDQFRSQNGVFKLGEIAAQPLKSGAFKSRTKKFDENYYGLRIDSLIAQTMLAGLSMAENVDTHMDFDKLDRATHDLKWELFDYRETLIDKARIYTEHSSAAERKQYSNRIKEVETELDRLFLVQNNLTALKKTLHDKDRGIKARAFFGTEITTHDNGQSASDEITQYFGAAVSPPKKPNATVSASGLTGGIKIGRAEVTDGKCYVVTHEVNIDGTIGKAASLLEHDADKKIFKSELYINPDQLDTFKNAQPKIDRVRAKGDIIAHEIDIPNESIMHWAFETIETFKARNPYFAQPIAINGKGLPPNCVEALQLYCKFKEYQYYTTSNTPRVLKAPQEVARQIKLITQLANDKAEPLFEKGFGMGEDQKAFLTQNTKGPRPGGRVE